MVSSSFNLENELSRGYNYGVLPSTIVKRAEVYKSSEARLAEGGVGGTVNIVTRKPLLEKNDTLFVLNTSAEYNDLTEEASPTLSGLGSWKITDTFGALVAIDYFDKSARRDALEVLNYSQRSFETQSGKSFTDVWVPGAIGSANFTMEQERKTAMVTLQYQPTDSIDMSLNYLKTDMSGNNLNTNLITLNHATSFHNQWVKNNAIIDATLDEDINTITSITYGARDWANPAADGQRTGWSAAIFRDSELTNTSYNFDIVYTGDDATVTFAAGASESEGGAGNLEVMRVVYTGKTTNAIDDGIGYAIFHDADLVDMSGNTAHGYVSNKRLSENDNKFVSLDAEYFLDIGPITTIQAGLRSIENTQRYSQWRRDNDFHKATDAHGKLRYTLSADELADKIQYTPDNFMEAITDKSVMAYGFIDPRDLKDFGIIEIENGVNNSYEVLETLNSAYVQANFEQEITDGIELRGNLGARYVEQETLTQNFLGSTTHNTEEGAELLRNFDYNYKVFGKTDELLPSVNAIFDLYDEYVVRFAASTVLSRPPFSKLAKPAKISVVTGNNQDDEEEVTRKATRGNPELEAFKAHKYDFSAEWYYKEASSIALGVFYYDVVSNFIDVTTQEDLTLDGDLWDVTQPQSVEGGYIKGIEFAVSHTLDNLPAPFDGLGFTGNVTLLDSKSNEQSLSDERELPFIGLSELTYNLGLFYSKDALDIRLSYNYRDEYYEREFIGLNRYVDDIKRVNAKVKYKFTDNLSAYVQANNLTDEQGFRYVGVESRPIQTSNVGRNFSVGVNYQF